MWLNVLLIFIFLVLGAVFSGTELALVSLRGSQLDQMEQEDARGARVAHIARDPNTFLSTVQLGVTLSGFLSASFGESAISPMIVPVVVSWGIPQHIAAPVTTIVLTLIISYCSIVISEMVPKRIAMQRTEQIARAVVPAIDVFAKICKPIIWLIGKNTNGLVRLLGFDPNETESEVSDEELRVLVNTNTRLGKDERTILDDVFDASETIVAEVMRPRADVVFLDPPRAGSTPEFLGAVDRMGPERIVYISCNPETQRRDLRLLAGWGWRARLLQPVDLFPHTEHVECVAVLAKIRGGGM